MFKTLVYADIFDYPLTASELIKWKIANDSARPVLTAKTAKYYHLVGRRSLVKLRRGRAHFSQLKLARARRAAKLLAPIPSIELIAVTGALAMNNADRDDDIDLMIVTSPNRLWLTRLICLVILQLLGQRRHYGSTQNQNKICLNLWLDETALSLPASQRNLYTAHEVAQVKPIFERDQAYEKFIKANLWLKRFLPNWKV